MFSDERADIIEPIVSNGIMAPIQPMRIKRSYRINWRRYLMGTIFLTVPRPSHKYIYQLPTGITQGLHYLQNRGVCHRDLSLENILVDEHNCLVIDMGLCLRVPYNSNGNPTSVVDATAGTLRRLIKPQGVCGKMNYMSPEILRNAAGFDGFAIDLWAAGVILYIMLTGFPPYDQASMADQRFQIIVEGALVDQLVNWDIILSGEAGDLLQSMFRLDPRDRLTLAQVMCHPWVVHGEIEVPTQTDVPLH